MVEKWFTGGLSERFPKIMDLFKFECPKIPPKWRHFWQQFRGGPLATLSCSNRCLLKVHFCFSRKRNDCSCTTSHKKDILIAFSTKKMSLKKPSFLWLFLSRSKTGFNCPFLSHVMLQQLRNDFPVNRLANCCIKHIVLTWYTHTNSFRPKPKSCHKQSQRTNCL